MLCLLSTSTKLKLFEYPGGFPGGTSGKNPPANTGDKRDTVRSLDQKDALEEKMANHSSSLAWEIQQTEEPEGLQSVVSERVRHDRSDLAR